MSLCKVKAVRLWGKWYWWDVTREGQWVLCKATWINP